MGAFYVDCSVQSISGSASMVRVSNLLTVDEVVFARDGDLRLLGSRTLEGFGAMIDARQKKLVAAGPYPAVGITGTTS